MEILTQYEIYTDDNNISFITPHLTQKEGAYMIQLHHKISEPKKIGIFENELGVGLSRKIWACYKLKIEFLDLLIALEIHKTTPLVFMWASEFKRKINKNKIPKWLKTFIESEEPELSNEVNLKIVQTTFKHDLKLSLPPEMVLMRQVENSLKLYKTLVLNE